MVYLQYSLNQSIPQSSYMYQQIHTHHCNILEDSELKQRSKQIVIMYIRMYVQIVYTIHLVILALIAKFNVCQHIVMCIMSISHQCTINITPFAKLNVHQFVLHSDSPDLKIHQIWYNCAELVSILFKLKFDGGISIYNIHSSRLVWQL